MGKSRTAQGIAPLQLATEDGFPNLDNSNKTSASPFIISRGGEYFFVPPRESLKTLSTLGKQFTDTGFVNQA
jgi:hypothetical protein